MKNWYIVQSHSSFENKVAKIIKEEAEKAKISEKIEEIVVPTHDVTEVKRGKRIQRKKKYFPGYILVKAEMDNNVSKEVEEKLIYLIKQVEEKDQFIKEMQEAGAGFAGFAAWLDMSPADSDMFGIPDLDCIIQLPWNSAPSNNSECKFLAKSDNF